jgi:hypothetical protein
MYVLELRFAPVAVTTLEIPFQVVIAPGAEAGVTV